MSQAKSQEKILAVILDGWGLNMPYQGNAPYLANTPTMDRLWSEQPTAILKASGEAVGLPAKQMGNSDVGHVTIGAGRVYEQALVRINKAVKNKSLHQEKIIQEAIQHVKDHHSKLHIKGLYSPGGVHSHLNHINAVIEVAKKLGLNSDQVYLHLITDGRDTAAKSGQAYIKQLLNFIKELNFSRISTIVGRFYAMDRDKNWERTDRAFDLYTKGKGALKTDALTAIDDSYQKDKGDEFIEPVKLLGKDIGLIEANDAVIFVNFRADRPRQIVQRFLENGPKNLYYATMTTYNPDFNVHVVYPETVLKNTIGEVLANNGIKQLRVTESVKYPHLTHFLNGKKEEPFTGEERIMVKTYSDITEDAERPQMRAPEIKEEIIQAIEKGEHQVIFTNFPNGDMVGHSGQIKPSIVACEVVDQALGEVIKVAKKHNVHVLVFADHGNCEELIDDTTGEPVTAHSNNRVPFILISDHYDRLNRYVAGLADVAPTMLKILEIKQPQEMTGQSLID